MAAWSIWIAALLWILYALLEGIREALYFYEKYHKGYGMGAHTQEVIPNEHPLFSAQRELVVSGMCLFVVASPWYMALLYAFILGVGLNCLFPFFHDGMYYVMYHFIDKKTYPKGWWDRSTTTSAKLSFTPIKRTLLMIAGFLILGILFYIKN